MRDHTEKKKRKRPSLLLIPGVLLLILALIGLYREPDLLQYAFLPEKTAAAGQDSDSQTSSMNASKEQENDQANANAAKTVSSAGNALEKYASFLSAEVWGGESLRMTICGTRRDVTVSLAGGTVLSDVTLQMVGPRFFELVPQTPEEGELLSSAQIASSSRAAVLDAELAFRLFGEKPKVGSVIRIDGTDFTVAGTVPHRRGFGSANAYTVWVPLGSCGLDPELLTASVVPAGEGFTTLWRDQARTVFGEGSWYGSAREKTRALLPAGFLVFFFALVLLKKWISLLKKWGSAFLEEARARRARSYPSRLIGFFALRLGAAAVLLAATLACFWGLAVFATRPMLLFPEWVPENPVALSSILSRFWSLIAENAAPVRVVTESVAAIGFYALMVRIGVTLLLLGALQTFRLFRGAEKDNP